MKVLHDVVQSMFDANFVTELFKPQEAGPGPAVKLVPFPPQLPRASRVALPLKPKPPAAALAALVCWSREAPWRVAPILNTRLTEAHVDVPQKSQ